MSIRQHFETALNGIQAEKERAISASRERVTREKIIPNNNAVDTKRNDAINELTQRHNQEIAKMQEAFNAEKQSIIAASEKSKSDFATAAIESEAALVSVAYDNAIHALKKQLSEIKE